MVNDKLFGSIVKMGDHGATACRVVDDQVSAGASTIDAAQAVPGVPLAPPREKRVNAAYLRPLAPAGRSRA